MSRGCGLVVISRTADLGYLLGSGKATCSVCDSDELGTIVNCLESLCYRFLTGLSALYDLSDLSQLEFLYDVLPIFDLVTSCNYDDLVDSVGIFISFEGMNENRDTAKLLHLLGYVSTETL